MTMSEYFLKSNTIVNGNVDAELLTPIIQDVQLLYLRPLLGTRLYDQILSQIGSSTVSAANTTLLDNYVLPCMKFYVLHELTPDLRYRYTNKGVMIKNSENSQPADLQEIMFSMDRHKNKAEKLAEICTKYLDANRATYTLYSANTEIYEEHPNKTNYRTGIYLDNDDDESCINYS